MKKLLIGILWISLSFVVKAQSIDVTYRYGLDQYTRGNYTDAIQVLSRVSFFDTLGVIKYNVYLKLADCYGQIQKYDRKAHYLDLAYNLSKTDSQKNEIIFTKAMMFIQQGKNDHAIIELFSLPENLSNYFIRKKNLYLAIAYFQKQDFAKSESFFKPLIQQDSNSVIRLEKRIKHAKKIVKRTNPAIAVTMSIIIPGLGQLYLGEIKQALNSMLLTSAFAVLFVHTAFRYSFADAAASVLPWYQRYFQGGFENAGQLALEKRELRLTREYNRILTLVSNHYP